MDEIQKKDRMKPRDVPSWDEYFLDLCKVVSTRSKDPSTQHGSVIVDNQNRIVSTGYNGSSRYIDDNYIDWSRPAKYHLLIHAEENSLWSAEKRNLEGCIIYVTGKPCSGCMLRISHSGIKRVVYGNRSSVCVDEKDWERSLYIANISNIKLEERC
jgi:dCMP deaminase